MYAPPIFRARSRKCKAMAEKTESMDIGEISNIVEQKKNKLKSLTNALKVSQRDRAIVEKREAREQELSVKRQEKMELMRIKQEEKEKARRMQREKIMKAKMLLREAQKANAAREKERRQQILQVEKAKKREERQKRLLLSCSLSLSAKTLVDDTHEQCLLDGVSPLPSLPPLELEIEKESVTSLMFIGEFLWTFDKLLYMNHKMELG